MLFGLSGIYAIRVSRQDSKLIETYDAEQVETHHLGICKVVRVI